MTRKVAAMFEVRWMNPRYPASQRKISSDTLADATIAAQAIAKVAGTHGVEIHAGNGAVWAIDTAGRIQLVKGGRSDDE